MPVYVNNLPHEFCWVQLYYTYLGPTNTTAYVRGKVTPEQERQTRGGKSNVSNETSRDPQAEKQQRSSSRGDGDYSLDAAERRTRTVDTGEGSRTRPVVSSVTSCLMSMAIDTRMGKSCKMLQTGRCFVCSRHPSEQEKKDRQRQKRPSCLPTNKLYCYTSGS